MPKKNYETNKKILPWDDDEESILNFYDTENPDITLFNFIDDELIRLGGSKLFFYKFERDEGYDDIYLEYKNKPIRKQPIIVWGHYEPTEIEEDLNQFGIELKNDQLFVFNKSYIERKLGRSAIPGDVIKPAFQEMKFDIFEVQESSFEVYGVYHLLCHARLLRDNESNQDTTVENNKPKDITGLGGQVGDRY